MAAADKTWTYGLTSSNGDSNGGTVTINANYGFRKISVVSTNGSPTVIGGYTAGSLAPAALSIINNASVTIIANENTVLDGITITCTGSQTCNIIGQA